MEEEENVHYCHQSLIGIWKEFMLLEYHRYSKTILCRSFHNVQIFALAFLKITHGHLLVTIFGFGYTKYKSVQLCSHLKVSLTIRILSVAYYQSINLSCLEMLDFRHPEEGTLIHFMSYRNHTRRQKGMNSLEFLSNDASASIL